MTQNNETSAPDILEEGRRADAQTTALGAETRQACKRAARSLTAYLGHCGEQALSHPQVNLIRAIHLAEKASGHPPRSAHQRMGMMAHLFTPTQMEIAVELLTESREGEEGEGWAILDELEAIAAEIQRAG